MSEKEKPTHTLPGGTKDDSNAADDGVVNDSLGKIDPADTTGTGEENQPCERREQSAHNGHLHYDGSPGRS